MGGLGGDVGLMSNRDIITTGWASSFSVILWHSSTRGFEIISQNHLVLES